MYSTSLPRLKPFSARANLTRQVQLERQNPYSDIKYFLTGTPLAFFFEFFALLIVLGASFGACGRAGVTFPLLYRVVAPLVVTALEGG